MRERSNVYDIEIRWRDNFFQGAGSEPRNVPSQFVLSGRLRLTPTRWQELQNIVNAALDIPLADREIFVEQSTGNDPELIAQVKQLLHGQDSAEGSLVHAARISAHELLFAGALKVGDHVGAYELTGVIGQGGMGTVFRAARTDDQFRLEVAVKVLRFGVGLESAMLTRFRVERQILADLSHPNIAHLLDGGVTAAGVPYLVMEYIEGLPIDAFVRKENIGIRERIQLIRKVCNAVQHAHQNLIVHRDIKPANVLVTPGGTPKLLDFGIAKLLASDALDQTLTSTQPADRLLTPAYASPEQIRGEPVATTTDVYSLGVLLYELLTSCRPYNTTDVNPVEAQRRICEEQPVRPGAMQPGLDRDLDDIVLMAIRKEPSRRYPSAEAFSADLDRYLAGFPVRAANGAWQYKAQKFLRRNKLAAASGLAILCLTGGWIFSLHTEQRRTQEHFNQVREMAETFLFRFDESIRGLTGSIGARKLVVSEGLKYFRLLAQGAAGDRALGEEVAEAYHRIALIQFQNGIPHIGDLAGSIDSLHQEEHLLESILKKEPANTRVALKLVACYGMLASNLRISSAGLKASQEYRGRNVRLLEDLSRKEPQNLQVQAQLSTAEVVAGDVAMRQGDPKAALARYRSALALRERLLTADPSKFSTAIGIAWCRVYIGDALGGKKEYTLGDFRGALSAYEQADAFIADLERRNPTKSEPRKLRAVAYARRSDVLSKLDDKQGALAAAQQELAIDLDLAQRDVGNYETQAYVAVGYADLANALAATGDLAGAVAAQEKQGPIYRRLVAANPSSLTARANIPIYEANLSEKLIQWSHFSEAEKHAQAAVAGWEDMIERDPETPAYRFYLAISAKLKGQAQRNLGRCRDAMKAFSQANAILTDPVRKNNVPDSAKNLSKELAEEMSACRP